jgi:hypothetical protein
MVVDNELVFFVFVCIDDLIIINSSNSSIGDLFGVPQLCFFVKDLGQIHLFLGIEVT